MKKVHVRYYVYTLGFRYFYSESLIPGLRPLYAIRLKHWAPIKAEEHKKDE